MLLGTRVRMYSKPAATVYVPLSGYSSIGPFRELGPLSPFFELLQSPLLRIQRPRRMPDRLTLSGHLIQDPPLLATFVCSHAGACAMPWRVHDGPTRMHTSCPSNWSPHVRETARVGSDTKCNIQSRHTRLRPTLPRSGPTSVATRLSFRPRFAQND
jgi:hypothetical protein